MDKYFIDQPIAITVPLVSDEVPAPTSVAYTIRTIAPTAADLETGTLDPNGDGVLTRLYTALEIGLRSIVEIEYVLDDGVADPYTNTVQFMAEAKDQLSKGVNSYQSYYDALLNAEDLSGIDSFKNADKVDQITALTHAYLVLNTMTYTDNQAEYYDLGGLDATALDLMDVAFLQALCYAQLIEANEMLDPNSLYQKRQDGLMSETIGESSMMFRAGNILNFPITRRSMFFLRNYTIIRARLQRG